MSQDQKKPKPRVMTSPLQGIPLPDIQNLKDYERGFWEGTRDQELRIQQCDACKMFRHIPTPMCPYCNSLRYVWTKVSGNGRVYSFVIVYHPVHPALRDREQTPYNICLIELEEQERLRMVSSILSTVPDDIHISMPVEVIFLATSDDPTVVLPMFVPKGNRNGIGTKTLVPEK